MLAKIKVEAALTSGFRINGATHRSAPDRLHAELGQVLRINRPLAVRELNVQVGHTRQFESGRGQPDAVPRLVNLLKNPSEEAVSDESASSIIDDIANGELDPIVVRR